MNRYILSLALCCVANILFAQSPLHRLVHHPALKHASVGVSVVDLSSNKQVVAHDAEKSLTPASTLKLITTATALELLGENYRYKTVVALDASDPTRIVVMGAGDPTLGSDAFGDNPQAFFENCARAIGVSLKKDNDYSIYVVDNLFGYDGVAPGWTWIDMGNYYAAGAYGISVYDNSYRLFFNTTDRKSCPRILRTEPQIKQLTFQNSLSLNSSGADNGYIYGVPFSNERELRGNIPAGRTQFSIKGDIPDPGLVLGETLGDYLSSEGFKITNVTTARDNYHSGICATELNSPPFRMGMELFTYVSPPMKEIVREVNVVSNNHYAEHLIRTIGRKYESNIYADPLAAGIDKVMEYWKEKGITTSSLQLYDGCGLAPQNAMSAQFLTDLLVYMYGNDDQSNAFMNSLPKAGLEGTLKSFLRNTPLKGKVLAKSGSIGGVQCFAGYLMDGEKKYAFSVMVNKFNGTRPQVRSAIEQFLVSLANANGTADIAGAMANNELNSVEKR